MAYAPSDVVNHTGKDFYHVVAELTLRQWTMRFCFHAFFLPVLAATADMDCTLLEKKTWERVSPDEQFDQARCACKRFPDDATQAIIIANERLAIVNVSTGEVLSDAGNIDMVTNDSALNIDTARYWVAPGVRAFGVRGWVSPHHLTWEEHLEQLNLYVRKGERIVPILVKLITHDAEDGLVNDECEDDTCTGSMSDIRRAVEIAKTATNGYFDLAVVETSRHCRAKTKAACQKSETWRNEVKRTYTLRYDGAIYRTTTDVPSDVMLFEQ